jgi:hypothetical protein
MQGYLSSEPLKVEKAGNFKPVVHLLADNGFDTYATTIETRRELVEKRPEVVQCFVDGSATGWYNYLYGDNKAANAAIRKDNPEMTDEQLAYSIEKMKEYGIVDSGDTLKHGIGAMTDERMKSFFGKMVKAGLFKADLDYKKSYTLQFVNKGVGLDPAPEELSTASLSSMERRPRGVGGAQEPRNAQPSLPPQSLGHGSGHCSRHLASQAEPCANGRRPPHTRGPFPRERGVLPRLLAGREEDLRERATTALGGPRLDHQAPGESFALGPIRLRHVDGVADSGRASMDASAGRGSTAGAREPTRTIAARSASCSRSQP